MADMGHREQLIAGAKQCLYEKGYARTTARDIVAASGTNLASIGYHFGSKEALLNVAMIEAFGDWGDQLGRVLGAESDADAPDYFELIWTRVIESFTANRELLVASFEIFAQVHRVPELKAELAEAHEMARHGLPSVFNQVDESAVDEKMARTVGSLYLALISGLMVQWLLDPERAPSGHDLAEGLRTLSRNLTS